MARPKAHPRSAHSTEENNNAKISIENETAGRNPTINSSDAVDPSPNQEAIAGKSSGMEGDTMTAAGSAAFPSSIDDDSVDALVKKHFPCKLHQWQTEFIRCKSKKSKNKACEGVVCSDCVKHNHKLIVGTELPESFTEYYCVKHIEKLVKLWAATEDHSSVRKAIEDVDVSKPLTVHLDYPLSSFKRTAIESTRQSSRLPNRKLKKGEPPVTKPSKVRNADQSALSLEEIGDGGPPANTSEAAFITQEQVEEETAAAGTAAFPSQSQKQSCNLHPSQTKLITCNSMKSKRKHCDEKLCPHCVHYSLILISETGIPKSLTKSCCPKHIEMLVKLWQAGASHPSVCKAITDVNVSKPLTVHLDFPLASVKRAVNPTTRQSSRLTRNKAKQTKQYDTNTEDVQNDKPTAKHPDNVGKDGNAKAEEGKTN